jgi:hypothetical protein
VIKPRRIGLVGYRARVAEMRNFSRKFWRAVKITCVYGDDTLLKDVFKLMGYESLDWTDFVRDIGSVAGSCDMLLSVRVQGAEVILLKEATVSFWRCPFLGVNVVPKFFYS